MRKIRNSFRGKFVGFCEWKRKISENEIYNFGVYSYYKLYKENQIQKKIKKSVVSEEGEYL